MLRLQLGQCFEQCLWWHVEDTSSLKFVPCLCLAKIVLDNPTTLPFRVADNDVSESNVPPLFGSWDGRSNTHHEFYTDLWEGREHLRSCGRSRDSAVNAFSKYSNHDIVVSNAPPGIRILVVWSFRKVLRLFVYLV